MIERDWLDDPGGTALYAVLPQPPSFEPGESIVATSSRGREPI